MPLPPPTLDMLYYCHSTIRKGTVPMLIIDLMMRAALLLVLAGVAVLLIVQAQQFHRAGMRRLAADQRQQPRNNRHQNRHQNPPLDRRRDAA